MGQDVANPAAMVLSSTMVRSLAHLRLALSRALVALAMSRSRSDPADDRQPQLLRHLGLDFHANAIAKATYEVLSEGKIRCVWPLPAVPVAVLAPPCQRFQR